MHGHQEMKLFDRLGRIRRYGLAEGSESMSVCFEVSKVYATPSLPLSACGLGCSSE